MKKLSSLLLAALVLAGSPAFAQQGDIAEARAATEHWLKLMDAEEYAAAWKSTSNGVHDGMPKFAWTTLASATHIPLGAIKSRKFKGATVDKPSADKPGLESITFVYVSQYEKSANVSETVTSVHEKDGVWRVSGFNISDGK
jgi:hypothetical protein